MAGGWQVSGRAQPHMRTRLTGLVDSVLGPVHTSAQGFTPCAPATQVTPS